MNDQKAIDELKDLKENPLVLIVSEDEIQQKTISAHLEKFDFDCVAAKEMDEGIAKAKELSPSCVILDSPAQPLTSYQETFQADNVLSTIPILVCAKSEVPVEEDDVKLDYIQKPYIKELLVHKVKTLIKFSNVNQKFQQTLRGKDDFLYVVSHDLKNPLGVISSCSELLVEDAKKLDQAHLDLSQRIKRNVRFCIDLVSNILDVARLEGGFKLKRENFKVKELILASNDSIELFATQRGINLVMDCPDDLVVNADLNKMQQVVNNIAGNSVKYTPKDGTIKIKAYSFTDESDDSLKLKLEISDTGMGIPANKIDTIFERMEQARDSDQNIGTGLGLFICKSISELHDGKIWVESVEEQGTTFHIIIPEASIEEPIKEEMPSGDVLQDILADIDPSEVISLEESSDQRSILIIDDAEDLHTLFKIFLKDYPVTVDCAGTGPSGIEKVKNNLYDLIFLDINMPGITGPKVIEIIRVWEKSQGLPETKIFATTVPRNDDDLQNFLNMGFSGFVEKPISKKSLSDLLSKHFENFVALPSL